MGLMEPVQKSRVPVAGKGELNFSEKAVVFRFGCGGELPVECFHAEEVEDQERINMRSEEEGCFLEVDEFPSDVMEQEENEEDRDHELVTELIAIEDRKALEAAADAILAEDMRRIAVSTDAKPGPKAAADYRLFTWQPPVTKHRLSKYDTFKVEYDDTKTWLRKCDRPITMRAIA